MRPINRLTEAWDASPLFWGSVIGAAMFVLGLIIGSAWQ